MAEVKALFPIGKTQWRKWGDEARTAYNNMRSKGYSHETGLAEANAVQARVRDKKVGIDDVINGVGKIIEVGEMVGDVAEAAAALIPAIHAGRAVARAVKPKKGK